MEHRGVRLSGWREEGEDITRLWLSRLGGRQSCIHTEHLDNGNYEIADAS